MIVFIGIIIFSCLANSRLGQLAITYHEKKIAFREENSFYTGKVSVFFIGAHISSKDITITNHEKVHSRFDLML